MGVRVLDVGGERGTELVQRRYTNPRLAGRERGARAGIAHPPGDLPRNAGTSLKVENFLATTAAALDDPELLSMKRMPRVGDSRQLRSVC